MAIDTTPSQVATSALQAIPFGSIIVESCNRSTGYGSPDIMAVYSGSRSDG